MEIQSEHAGGLRALPRISLTPEEAAASTGFSVRRIFQALGTIVNLSSGERPRQIPRRRTA